MNVFNIFHSFFKFLIQKANILVFAENLYIQNGNIHTLTIQRNFYDSDLNQNKAYLPMLSQKQESF